MRTEGYPYGLSRRSLGLPLPGRVGGP